MKIFERFTLNNKVIMLAMNHDKWLREIVEALLDAGASKVIVTANGHIKLPEIKKVVKIELDFLVPSRISEMFNECIVDMGRLDGLVNFFDLPLFKPSLQIGKDEWEKILRENLEVCFFICQAAGKIMLQQGFGSIVNLLSIIGSGGAKNSSVYALASGSVDQLTRLFALEWASKGVRINSIRIGFEDNNLGPKEKKYIPLARGATIEDVVPLIVFLLSSASSYMSGYIYHVDGGLSVRG